MKKQLFRFSGIVTPTDKAPDWEFEGYFVKQEGKDDIIGINRNIVGNSFIKGLFIDNLKLIFVEMSEEMRAVRGIKYHQKGGYVFKDINGIGKYSENDMEGIFAWTDGYAVIQLNEITDLDQVQVIEKQYKEFYQGLDDWDRFFFNNTRELTDFL